MRANVTVIGLAVLATALAGCTGNFDIKQTEPFRVEVNGDAKETRLAAAGSGSGEKETSEFKIVKPSDVEVVKVIVKIKNVEIVNPPASPTEPPATTANDTTAPEASPAPSGQTVVILIIIEDRDTKEKLAEQRVEADESGADVDLDVNVKGHDNVVIVTQAVQGAADVSVAAQTGEPMASPTAETTAAPTTTY